ncbi:lipid A export permease/ATP-binding protein MsbA [uncultured Methylibium sp.]|uniref:lipid A export permease/ATP-binding protein MsbA n=1 Tax=uncultured Methylibium sp. TaxID=381093 RepID=UPI0025EB7E9F|nr:lipid A export permease/ATP-binding protein MsbA [uncultured Methylibium sp.]
MSERSSHNLSRLKAVWPYFSDARRGLVLAALGASVGAATEPLLAYMMKPLLDSGFSSQAVPLWMVPAVILGLFLVRGVAGFVVNYALAWTANQGTLRMRHAMFARLLDADPGLFNEQSTSKLINSVVYEVQSGSNLLVNAVQTLIKDSLTAVALLGYLIWINWQLTLFIAALFPAVAIVMRVFGKRMHGIAVASQRATDELAYVVEENVLAWRIVRLHGAAPAQGERFRRASDGLRQLMLKATVAASTVTPVTQMLAAAALSAVITAALWQASTGGSTVGGFVSFVTAMLMLITPLKHLSEVAGPITRGLAAVQRGLTLIEDTPVERGGNHAVARARGELCLESVSLRYSADKPPALDGVSLTIAAGETLALVGPSGSGKSTLVNLLPRFLEPQAGRVLLDGVALPDWDLLALRRQFALVSQDVVLFNDSVAVNVALGYEIDVARVRAALAGANLLDFAEGLPQGIDSTIGHNGNQLSGGQRQRLAIARAIYKDAPLLILDEATSALDSESERLVQTALERLMVGRTSVVIAHRLSTIEAADRVAVLDRGRVVEQGSHAELLARGGLFARLHALQFKTDLETAA